MFCASEKIQDDGEIVEKIDHFHLNNPPLLLQNSLSALFISHAKCILRLTNPDSEMKKNLTLVILKRCILIRFLTHSYMYTEVYS